MIVSGRREKLVASAQHVLPHDIRRHIRIARLGQIAVRGAADEAAFALWIEPASGLPIGNDGSCRGAGNLFAARRIWLLSSLRLALSSASTLVAAATSVVTMVALTGMTLLLVAIALLAATALWMVLLLLLTAAVARPIGGRGGWRTCV
jgi:hypothetical protein